jgi:hypothetical protein
MITNKSTCGLCKPHKKWKKNNEKKKQKKRMEILTEVDAYLH